MAAINIPIISEYSPKGIQSAIKDFERLESKTAKAGFALKKAFVPATAALGGLAAAAVPAVNAASDLEESFSKVNVIFGDGAEAVTQFAETAATQLGQSQQAVLDAAGTFGTFGKAAGLSGQDLAQFSNDFTTLAADLASFNNTTPEQAVEAIGAALRGESEPLRAYGVLLNDATLKAEALELGIYDGTGALTDQQKILAAQAAIYKQTGDAQGDFARTSDGLANQTRIMSAQFDNFQAQLGQALLPVVMELLPILTGITDWMTDNTDIVLAIGAAIGTLAAAVITANVVMGIYNGIAALTTIVNAALATSFTALQVATGLIVFTALIAGLVYLEKKFGLVSKAVQAVIDLFDKLGDGIGWLAEKLGLVGDEIDENFTQTVDEAREAAGDMYEQVREMGGGVDDARSQFERAIKPTQDYHKATRDAAESTEKLTERVDHLWRSTDELYKGMFALNPELQRYLDQLDREEAVRDFNTAVEEFQQVAQNNAEGSAEWEEANKKVYEELANVIEIMGNVPQEVQTQMAIYVETGQLDLAIEKAERLAAALGFAVAGPSEFGIGSELLPEMADLQEALGGSGYTGTTFIRPEVPTTIGTETGTSGIRIAAPTMSTISTERGTRTVTNNVTVNTLNANAETGRNIADALAAYQRVRGFVR